ncbi:MAG: tRNA pseudouridine(38-40) synthase TruA [Chitinophagaceae bacterium]
MNRYFIEVSYMGTRYSGFQVQENANTIQTELTKALTTIYKQPFELTGSSRTDAGVHALQNFFHFDTALTLTPKNCYAINAVLPPDIACNNIYKVSNDAHSRFLATARKYAYHIYQHKNPLLTDRAYFFPFPLNFDLLQQAAALLQQHQNFASFSKRHTQVNNFNCTLTTSYWEQITPQHWVYHVQGNRFLRGMVRGLVGTMLRVGRGNYSLAQLAQIIAAQDCTKADFSTPPHGLFLEKVIYPQGTLHL